MAVPPRAELAAGRDAVPPLVGLAGARRWRAAAALSLAVTATVLANSGVAVTLPLLAASLGRDGAQVAWVSHAYLLAGAIGLLPAAALGDRIGPGATFRWGVVLFSAAGLAGVAAALAKDPLPLLLAARFAQGLGAAAVMGVSMALMRAIHPLRSLGRFMGLNASVVAAAHASGPALAGSIGALVGWEAVFLLLAGLGLMALVLSALALPAFDAAPPKPFDFLGAALQAVVIASLAFALTQLRSGFAAAAAAALGMLLAVAWVRRERRRGFGLLPLDLLAQPRFAASYGTAAISFVAQMAVLVAAPFHLQARGLEATVIPWVMTSWPLSALALAPLAGSLADRLQVPALASAGLVVAGASIAGLLCLPAAMPPAACFAAMACAGAGFTLFTAPNARGLAAAAPPGRAAAVGGIHAMSRQAGQLAGSALAGLFLAQPSQRAGSAAALGAAALAAGLGAAVMLIARRHFVELPSNQT